MVLQQSLQLQLKHAASGAIILAAGFGTRLRKISNSKPMAKIGDRTCLQFAIESFLSMNQIDKIAINTHWQSEIIQEFVITCFAHEPRLLLLDESIILGTGGGILNAMHKLDKDTLFVRNSDILFGKKGCNVLQLLLQNWNPIKMHALLLLIDIAEAAKHGVINRNTGDFSLLDDGRLIASSNNHYIYTGCGIISYKLFDEYQHGAQFALGDVLNRQLDLGVIHGIAMQKDQIWLDIGTPENFAAANMLCINNNFM